MSSKLDSSKPTKDLSSKNPSLIQRLFNKLDQKMKEKAESTESCCCCDEDKPSGKSSEKCC